MPWWTDFQLIMRSSWTTLREKLEDPERVLHQLLIDMEDELAAVRSRVADAIVDEVASIRGTKTGRYQGLVRDARAICEAAIRFWHPDGDGGWRINDWAEYQESSEETQKRSEKARKAAQVRWSKKHARSIP